MEIKQFIEENIENMKTDLAELVSYNTVLDTSVKPFGENNRKVLDKAIELMNNKGFDTKNLDYYCGYGQIGQGDETIGVVAHLDIVPAGDGWDSNPFEMVEKDGYLFGRGVSDDKGAAVASMYALKYLLDENYPLTKKVRLILGCNEETGSRCVAHYAQVEGHFDYGFTPDGNFPGIYAEKGMVFANVIGHNTKIIDIKGGDVSNAVCKRVECELPLNSFNEEKFKAYLNENNIKFDYVVEDTVEVTVYGVSAHASTPDLGVNAFSYLMEALYHADFNDSFVNWFDKNFALEVHGEKIGFLDLQDDISNTSINFGIVKKNGNDIAITLDMRFPVKTTYDKCFALLNKLSEEENEVVCEEGINPLYFDINSPFIKALKKAYEDVTGDHETKMEAIGGGTYAKELHNCIAFGCEFPDGDNHIHDVNERLSVEEFKKQVELYVQAIKNLNEI